MTSTVASIQLCLRCTLEAWVLGWSLSPPCQTSMRYLHSDVPSLAKNTTPPSKDSPSPSLLPSCPQGLMGPFYLPTCISVMVPSIMLDRKWCHFVSSKFSAASIRFLSRCLWIYPFSSILIPRLITSLPHYSQNTSKFFWPVASLMMNILTSNPILQVPVGSL